MPQVNIESVTTETSKINLLFKTMAAAVAKSDMPRAQMEDLVSLLENLADALVVVQSTNIVSDVTMRNVGSPDVVVSHVEQKLRQQAVNEAVNKGLFKAEYGPVLMAPDLHGTAYTASLMLVNVSKSEFLLKIMDKLGRRIVAETMENPNAR